MSIIVVGSALVDITVKHPDGFSLFTEKGRKYFSIPYGSKIEVKQIELHVGGSGRNVASDLSRLGHSVNFVNRLGSDYLSKQIVSDLKREGVGVKNLRIVKNGEAGFSIIFLLADGEKSIMVHNGKNLDMNIGDVPKQDLNAAKWLVFTSVTSKNSLKFLKEMIRVAKKNNVKILANPSIRMIRLRKKELKQFVKDSDIVIMNEEEISELTGIKKPVDAVKKLNRLGAKIAVATLGTQGAVAYDGKRVYSHKGYRVKVVDSTGCGDSFTAGFLHYIIRGKTIPEALKFANLGATLQCLKVGSQSLSEKEILSFSSKN
jgi:sugar/nucleoside kinase (ribokinase family)